MKNSNRLSSRSVKAVLVAAAMLLPATGVLADTIYIATKGGNPLQRTGLTITKIEKTDDGEVLKFTTAESATATKKLDDIVRIEADGEPIFNQAETEFFNGDLQAASDDYSKAIASSTKEWVKHRADVRLLFIAGKTGNFLGAVNGFVELARKDPTSAAAHAPAIPDKSTQLGAAIAAVNTGLTGATTESKLVLYPYLIQLYNKNSDPKGAEAALGILKRLQPKAAVIPGVPTGIPDNTSSLIAEKQAEADTALTKANAAFAAHDYDKAIAAINAASPAFVDPVQQSKALYLIAEARAASATTPAQWEEAAMAYMRVVAHFKSQPDGPAADALYKTGTIEEKLNKVTEAKLIYGQVVNEYKDSKAAQDAQAALTRLAGR